MEIKVAKQEESRGKNKVCTIGRLLKVDVGVTQRPSGDHVPADPDGEDGSGRRKLLEEHRLGHIRSKVANVEGSHRVVGSGCGSGSGRGGGGGRHSGGDNDVLHFSGDLLLFRQTARFYFREKCRSGLSVTKVRDNKHEEVLKRREGGEFAPYIFLVEFYFSFFDFFLFFYVFWEYFAFNRNGNCDEEEDEDGPHKSQHNSMDVNENRKLDCQTN
jgi:hypothetical protein